MRNFIFKGIKFRDFLKLLDYEQIIVLYKSKKITITEQSVEELSCPYLTHVDDDEVYEKYIDKIRVKNNKLFITIDY